MALDLNDKTSNANNFTTNNNVADYTATHPFAASTIAGDFTPASSSYLSRADTASLSITSDFTFELWARFDATPSSGNAMTLVSKFDDNGTTKYSYIWQLRNVGGTLKSWANYSADGASPTAIMVNWTPSTATWYHMAITFEHTAKAVKFYINGSQQGTTQTGATTTIYDGTAPFSIGAWDLSSGIFDRLDGQITEVRIWNVERTSTEINNNKSTHLTGSETGLVAYWPFESLATSSVKDMIQAGIIPFAR
jgi:hypothetical protein